MNMPILLPVVIAVLVSSTLGCRHQDDLKIQQLRWLKTADPISDAKKAITSGDHRLRAIYGLTLSIPATNANDFDSCQRNYGLNPIEGTTDCLINQEHGQLVILAIKYAEIYNRQILTNYKPEVRP